MISIKGRVFSGLAAIAGAAMLAAPAAADEVAEFYKGKQIVAVSGGGAGGGFALAARILGMYMPAHIPGNPEWVVQAMPGAGGARSIRYIVNAAPQDGTVIGVVLPPSVLSPLLRPDVGYDSAALRWVGSITPMPAVLSVWHTAPAKTLEEAKQHEIVIATSSRLSTNYFVSEFLNQVIGTRFKVISGYQGGDAQNIAMESGEVHGRASFYNSYKSTKPDWLREKKIVHLLTMGPELDEVTGVPTLMDVVKTEEHRQMVAFMQTGESVGHGFFVSPNVPRARLEALRQAFDATMKDPGFLAESAKRNQIVDPVRGEKLDELVQAAMKTPKEVVDKFKAMVRLDEPEK
jgi:tripartite-type tricarboxylate transporter receptor subunit TctC